MWRQDTYIVLNPLTPSELEWLRQQSEHVAEVYRQSLDTSTIRREFVLAAPNQEPRALANAPDGLSTANGQSRSRPKKSNREILCEVDAYIAQYGRELTPDEEREVLDLPSFE